MQFSVFLLLIFWKRNVKGFVTQIIPLYRPERPSSSAPPSPIRPLNLLFAIENDGGTADNDIDDIVQPAALKGVYQPQPTTSNEMLLKKSLPSNQNIPKIFTPSDLDQQVRRFQNKRAPSPASRSSRTIATNNSNGFRDDDDGGGMEEWRELQRQIEEEELLLHQDMANMMPLPSIIEESREKGAEERKVLETLLSPSGDFFMNSNIPSISGGVNYDEVNLPPGAVPSQYQKKYISDFEVTEDGGVYLSPEAYQQACESAANPDGSLNLRPKNGNGTPSPRSIFSPSILEAVTARPMAPYGNDADNQKPITLEDLSEQVRKAKEYIEQNPNAQEELHQRIMAEEEANSSDSSSKLFQEALTDPEKARQFWNQEYFETKRQQTEALEKLLDERLQWFKDMSAQHAAKAKQEQFDNKLEKSRNVTKSEPVFVPKDEQEEFLKSVEQDRLQHARNVAQYYQNNSDEWYTIIEGNERDKIDTDVGNMVQVTGISAKAAEKEEIEKGEWVFMEDTSMSDEPFYWNTVTEEMRWDPPTE
jgi:hypothetical protein